MPVNCKDGLVAQLVNLAGTAWCTRFDSDPNFVTSRGVSVVNVQQKILSGFVVYAAAQSTQLNTKEIGCEG